MKKIATVIMLLAVTLSMLSGCFRIPKDIIQQLKPSAADSQATAESAESPRDDDAQGGDNGASDASNAPASLTTAKNPSQGYQNYLAVKGDAIDRITKAAETSDALNMTVTMSVLGYSMMDLSLLWLTLFTDDIMSTETAMAFFGMKDVKVTSDGSGYTITFKDSDGASAKQTCQYDAGKDQLTSTMYDADNNVTIFFEYVNLGDHTYAAQYYTPEDGEFKIVRAYFDTSDVAAFGSVTASEKPASIIGKSGLDEDFVKNEESYFVLKGGELTVFDQGESSTN
jgi:hypothetical protein